MELINEPQDMIRAFAAFERSHWNSLPERVQSTIEENRGSPIDMFARTAEALYANLDKLKNQASKILLAQLARLCDQNGWQDWRGGRGRAVYRAVARDLGEPPPEGETWPDPESDPEPQAQYREPDAPADPE